MIALAVLANSGRTAVPPALLRLAPIGALRDAVTWGLATRLARRIGGARWRLWRGRRCAWMGRRWCWP
jgi:hypothetical protein